MANKTESPLATVYLRNLFYRDGFRNLVIVLALQSFAIVLLGIIVYQMWSRTPEPKYFATTNDGKLIPLVPVTQPLVSTATLLQWTSEAATKAYTFNFAEYRQQLGESSGNFTAEGWDAFQQALVASGNLEAVKQRRMIVTSHQTGPGVITWQGMNPDTHRYTWKVEFPISVNYEGSGSSRFEQKLIAAITVVRVPTTESGKGIAIDQFVTKSAGT